MAEPDLYSAPVIPIRGELQDEASRIPLQSSGGGGTFDGMEARIARLESDVDYIKRDIGEIKTKLTVLDSLQSGIAVLLERTSHLAPQKDLSTLTERVAHLPSKGFIVSAVTAALGILAAFLIFGQQIKAIIGVI